MKCIYPQPEGFNPSDTSRKLTLAAADHATVSGLDAQAQCYAMIVAIESDGNQSWSNQLIATTSSTAALRSDDVVHLQEAEAAPQVTPTAVTYMGSSPPQVHNLSAVLKVRAACAGSRRSASKAIRSWHPIIRPGSPCPGGTGYFKPLHIRQTRPYFLHQSR